MTSKRNIKAADFARKVRRDSKGNAVPYGQEPTRKGRKTPTRKKPPAKDVLRKYLSRNELAVDIAEMFVDHKAADADVLATLATLADLYGYKLVQVTS